MTKDIYRELLDKYFIYDDGDYIREAQEYVLGLEKRLIQKDIDLKKSKKWGYSMRDDAHKFNKELLVLKLELQDKDREITRLKHLLNKDTHFRSPKSSK